MLMGQIDEKRHYSDPKSPDVELWAPKKSSFAKRIFNSIADIGLLNGAENFGLKNLGFKDHRSDSGSGSGSNSASDSSDPRQLKSSSEKVTGAWYPSSFSPSSQS